MSPAYAGLCGITEDELAGLMRPDVELLGERLDVGAEEAIAQIDERGHLVPWEADETRLVKVGASFDVDQRTLGEWIVRETTR